MHFTFYEEIQFKYFSENLPVDYADIPAGQRFCQNHSNLLHFRDKHVFAFYTDIQDGRQKCWENDLAKTLRVDSAATLWVKKFVKIALALSITKINTFLHFTQKCKMATKSGGKTILAKTRQ